MIHVLLHVLSDSLVM